MPKDRFSKQKRGNWDKEWRWGPSPYKTICKKENKPFNQNQKLFISSLINNYKDKLSVWEKDFLIVLSNSVSYSDRQKITLKEIVKKISVK